MPAQQFVHRSNHTSSQGIHDLFPVTVILVVNVAVKFVPAPSRTMKIVASHELRPDLLLPRLSGILDFSGQPLVHLNGFTDCNVVLHALVGHSSTSVRGTCLHRL
jgi:hypothetical protein